MSASEDWLIYSGGREPHDGIARLPPPPPWRSFNGGPVMPVPGEPEDLSRRRLGTYNPGYFSSPDQVEMVNAALYLRRPLLVTGRPGTGKSTLAFSVARELRLGPALRWRVTSRSTLQDALYRYDAVARLQDASLATGRSFADDPGFDRQTNIGRYIQLGPLGTALLPWNAPRVLLIDELDRSDIDLPEDLLDVLEEGEFQIPELARVAGEIPEADVGTADGGSLAVVMGGQVRCAAFPLVLITSNGERNFSPAFLRHCLQLDIAPPDAEHLFHMVEAQLGPEAAASAEPLIQRFLERREYSDLAADQLLNALYLTNSWPHEDSRQERLTEALLRGLSAENT